MFRSTLLPRSLSAAALSAMLLVAAGCTTAELSAADDSSTAGASAVSAAAIEGGVTSDDTSVGVSSPTAAVDADDLGAVGALASNTVHEISVEVDDADVAAMLTTYASTGEKEWIEATVTIDGTTFESVGLRLKGNSSLRGLTGDATDTEPSELPWLIRLDEFVDGQHLDGLTDLVVRSNNTETALNEAVALELLEAAGLASQDAMATSFSVNGADPVLRLVIDHPDDAWMAEWFDDDGALYKAESTGDYSYRGDDPDSYDEVFDQEAGKDNADLEPLTEFLAFLNDSDDATFAAELEDHLDVDSFATYLAMQELLNNFDDIDGPGNNSYLYWDADTERFTVVAWDHNLAFGVLNGGGGGGPGGGPLRGDAAEDGVFPAPGRGGAPPDVDGRPPIAGGTGDAGGPNRGGSSNVLVDRFLAVAELRAMYEDRLESLRGALFDSGAADELLSAWSAIVESSGLVDSTVVAADAGAIADQFT